MEHDELARRLHRRYLDSLENEVVQNPKDVYRDCGKASIAITELLVRAKAAEARVHELETAYCLEKCEDGPECAELGKARRAMAVAEARAEKAESERDEYFKHLQGLCFCCAHRTDGFDCHVKCYGHKRGSAWVYAGPRKEE